MTHAETSRLPIATAPAQLALTSSARSRPTSLPDVAWATSYRRAVLAADAALIVAFIVVVAAVHLAVAPDASARLFSVLAGSIATVAVWLLALSVVRSRDRHVFAAGADEYKRVVNGSALAWGLLAVGAVLLDIDSARWALVLTMPVGTVLLLAGRWSARRRLLAARRAGAMRARALVVGSSSDVEAVIDDLVTNEAAGYEILGYAADAASSEAVVGRAGAVPFLATRDEVAVAAHRARVESVILVGSAATDADAIRRLSWELEGTAVELVLCSRIAHVAEPRIRFRNVPGMPLLNVDLPRFEGWRYAAKRSFDIVVAAVALVLLFPLLLVVAAAVRLDSAGPALFRQRRCGRDGQVFEMLKFRSMRVGAEADLAALRADNEGAGVLFKLKADPRVTRIGRVLRRHSLDELPQLWNILRGDMSFVGPRPPLETEVAAYETDTHRRLLTKPGLTGLWQVSGRSDLSWEESVRLDLYYVENWSLTGDLLIMWQTVKIVARPEGAY